MEKWKEVKGSAPRAYLLLLFITGGKQLSRTIYVDKSGKGYYYNVIF